MNISAGINGKESMLEAPSSSVIIENDKVVVSHQPDTEKPSEDERSSVFKREELKALLEITRIVNSSLDLGKVLHHVMDQIIKLSKAERGFLMLKNKDGELEFRVARNMDKQTIEASKHNISKTIVGQVAEQGQAILTSNAQEDPRFSANQSIICKNLRSILCIPLKVKESVTGVIYIENHCHVGIFDQHDRDLLTAFSNQAAISIENARLHKQEIGQRLKMQELATATKIQKSFLPDEIPHPDKWDIAARWCPMKEVAGDFYDFCTLSDGRLALVIADVSDKGVPAALVMSLCITVMRFAMEINLAPDEVLARTNHSLMKYHKAGMLATVFIGYLNLENGELEYANGGHNAPIIFRKKSDTSEYLKSTGALLGFFPDSEYNVVKTVVMDPGDILLMYTDGISEEINHAEEMFGEERIEELIKENRDESANTLISNILSEVRTFSEGQGIVDDKTITAVKCLL